MHQGKGDPNECGCAKLEETRLHLFSELVGARLREDEGLEGKNCSESRARIRSGPFGH
jgi:hypothetical protein